MGEIKCVSRPDVVDLIARLRQKSKSLDGMITDILKDGDLTFHLVPEPYSWYDNRNICIGVKGDARQTEPSVASEVVMEICNAWYDVKGKKPNKTGYQSGEAYAEAMEFQEWYAIQDHVKIFDEVRTSGLSTFPVSRFKQAFWDPKYSWGKFENYLAFQKEQGHTAKIASHFKK